MEKIAILVTQLERAGSQKIAISQARYFHQQGYDVSLCFLYDKYGLLSKIVDEEPYHVVSFNAKVPQGSFILNSIYSIRAFWRLYWFLRKNRIQVIETLTFYSNVIGITIGWLAGVFIRISSQRRTLMGFPKYLLKLDAWLVNSPLVDRMVTNSKRTRKFCLEVEGIKPEKLSVIYNGVNIDVYRRDQWSQKELSKLRASLDISPGSTIITTIARLHPQKGHKYLVLASSGVVKLYADVIFMLVGDGKERERIQHLINNTGVSDNFRLVGIRDDVPKLLALSDVFVLPSLYEGMPNALLEAMAAKLPVIASDVDGISEVVVDGETGFLVPRKTPDLLEKKIISLMENQVLCQRLGENGYRRVKKNFSERNMCQHYEKLIRGIYLGKKG